MQANRPRDRGAKKSIPRRDGKWRLATTTTKNMSWADRAKAALRRGETVTVRPRGHSMRPKVNDGDLVTLVPCLLADLAVGSIVLVRVGGNDYLHLVTAIDAQRVQIGNNRDRINGWVGPAAIYGRAVKVEA